MPTATFVLTPKPCVSTLSQFLFQYYSLLEGVFLSVTLPSGELCVFGMDWCCVFSEPHTPVGQCTLATVWVSGCFLQVSALGGTNIRARKF